MASASCHTGENELHPAVQDQARLHAMTMVLRHLVHDMNNIVTVVKGNNKLAIKRIDENNAAYHNLENISDSINIAGSIFHDLQLFTGRAHSSEIPVNLNESAEEALTALQTAMPASVRIAADRQPVKPVTGDRKQFVQMISSLLNNACEAMPADGGNITLTTGEMLLDSATAKAAAPDACAKAGNYSFLQVSDNGEGITPENLPQIFDPFFTTRLRRPGMGLTVMLGIVRRHNGVVFLHSQPQHGTTIRIAFKELD